MKKISICTIVFVLLLTMFAAGCSNEPAQTGTGQADNSTKQGKEDNQQKPAPAPKEEQVIRFWAAPDMFKDDGPGAAMVQAFNEKHKGEIRVDLKYMPWAEYNTAIQAAIASNDLPDIFNLPQKMNLNTFVEHQWIRSLDDIVTAEWKKQFYASAFVDGVNVIDGKTYTWPDTGPQLKSILYYNKDVLRNAGLDPEKPPKTWAEFRAMAKTVTEKGKGDVYGYIFGGAAASDVNLNIQSFAGGVNPAEVNGSDIFYSFNYKKGKYSYDSKAWSDSVKFILDLKNDRSIFPATYTIKPPEAAILFGEGKAAFLIDARWRMWLLKRDTPDANFGMAAVPTPDGSQPVYGYTIATSSKGFVVSANTKHPEAVGKFVTDGLASKEFYNKVLQGGVVLSPIEELNKDKSAYPYPEFETFAQLHDDLLRTVPDPVIRNPQVQKVMEAVGGINQPAIKPSIGELLQMIITGKEKDIEGTLKAYNDKMNQGLLDGIKKAQDGGAKVSENDFVFPNWDPFKNFTDEDYKTLK
jgi:multiple sugar transport system substrate-binding protein